ncbi:hypothetical protein, partial [Winogradskyella sediminis]|uniref:hypothetical protein n=1 Tax=Winogradskyella sediminis TaxID=1382466 RepID=UPI000E27EA18
LQLNQVRIIIHMDLYIQHFRISALFCVMFANGFVYGKLRFCVRVFSEGKSDVTKQATNIG